MEFILRTGCHPGFLKKITCFIISNILFLTAEFTFFSCKINVTLFDYQEINQKNWPYPAHLSLFCNKPRKQMAEPIIELRNVNIYQGSNLVLQDVNLTVNKGEFVYLVGKTGTGKSSLLKTLYGELELREGEGTVAGFSLRGLDWKKVPYLRRNLGVVFQDFQLLTDRNVNDNMKFVLKATGWTDQKLMDEKIADVLDKVGLKSKGFKMPFELSGGEQQRIDIARALLNSPKLILADEPTGNLDPETSDEIMTLLFQICRDYNTAVVMASHDYIVVQKFPARMIRTERGRVLDNATISIE
jgi:cell division transport system ATP-binding protein